MTEREGRWLCSLRSVGLSGEEGEDPGNAIGKLRKDMEISLRSTIHRRELRMEQ